VKLQKLCLAFEERKFQKTKKAKRRNVQNISGRNLLKKRSPWSRCDHQVNNPSKQIHHRKVKAVHMLYTLFLRTPWFSIKSDLPTE
jgi:hypothetical protein